MTNIWKHYVIILFRQLTYLSEKLIKEIEEDTTEALDDDTEPGFSGFKTLEPHFHIFCSN